MEILVVDDDETFVDKMKKLLELSKQKVTVSYSGSEALHQLKEKHFDLVLTDLKMPDFSGVELLKRARAIGNESIFIVLTGYGTIESAVEAIKFGAFDYLLKPFDFSDVMNKFEEVENEIRLRENINGLDDSSYSSSTEDYFSSGTVEGNSPPFLVISDDDPDLLIKKFNLSQAQHIKIGFDVDDVSISASKLFSLKSKVEEFTQENEFGTIIFKGIEKLSQIHNWNYVKRFITYLNDEIIASSRITLIVLVEEDNSVRSQYPYYDALSLLSNTVFKKIIEIVSHPLRKNIIALLKTEDKLKYNEILEQLSVDRSSVLAFHMNKLVKEEIIAKEDKIYRLSSKGHDLASIINVIENLGLSSSFSSLQVQKFQKN